MEEILHKLYQGTTQSFFSMLATKINKQEKVAVVTINSEHLQKQNRNLFSFYLSETTHLVADGIAVYTIAKLNKIKNLEKIPGVLISEFLLDYANTHHLSVAVLGASKESLELFNKKVSKTYPNISKLALTDGYVAQKDDILQGYAQQGFDIILLGLGVPLQEQLIANNIQHFTHGVLVGVGGSIDVIGGYKKRAPALFLNTNTEWLYRIVKEPKRLLRFIQSNVQLVYYGLIKRKY